MAFSPFDVFTSAPPVTTPYLNSNTDYQQQSAGSGIFNGTASARVGAIPGIKAVSCDVFTLATSELLAMGPFVLNFTLLSKPIVSLPVLLVPYANGSSFATNITNTNGGLYFPMLEVEDDGSTPDGHAGNFVSFIYIPAATAPIAATTVRRAIPINFEFDQVEFTFPFSADLALASFEVWASVAVLSI